MKKLLLVSIFVLAFCIGIFAQTKVTSPCPAISITKPSGGYMGRGQKVDLSANVENHDWQKLNYSWKLSNNISFEGQGTPVINFAATEDMQMLTVTAEVELKGLPESCKNNVSESFQILFDPGVPRAIDDYEKISFADERARLYGVFTQIKKEPDSVAFFIISFTKNESYSVVKSRTVRIKNFLTKKLQVNLNNLKFEYIKSDIQRTTIYFVPQNVAGSFLDGEENLEKLFSHRKTKKLH